MTENKGENKLDELLKERYELAKGRLSEICTETVVEEKFLDFFHKEAAFLLEDRYDSGKRPERFFHGGTAE